MSKTHYRYCSLLRYVHTHTRTHVLHHTAMVSYKYSHTRTHTSFCKPHVCRLLTRKGSVSVCVSPFSLLVATSSPCSRI